MARTHIIGAGLSGLSAAVRVAERGGRVSVYDSAGQAGGRCRSFFDKHLERDIDNGNHLIMSGNKSALDFLKIIGSDDPLVGPPFATYPFVDVATGARWTVRLNEGPIPFWMLGQEVARARYGRHGLCPGRRRSPLQVTTKLSPTSLIQKAHCTRCSGNRSPSRY